MISTGDLVYNDNDNVNDNNDNDIGDNIFMNEKKVKIIVVLNDSEPDDSILTNLLQYLLEGS